MTTLKAFHCLLQARELGDAQGAGSGEDATETSDLDTVWQPQLTAEEGQGPDSQHEVNSPPPGTAVAAPSGGPVNRQPDHQPDAQAEAASPAADFDAAAVREDSDRTVASTPSDLDDGGDDKGAQAGTQAGWVLAPGAEFYKLLECSIASLALKLVIVLGLT